MALTSEAIVDDPLLEQCSADPAKAQLAMQQSDDGVVDWAKADWANPLLKPLAGLSVLSSHDMPHTATLLARPRRDLTVGGTATSTTNAPRQAAVPISSDAAAVPFVPNIDLKHAHGCSAASASSVAFRVGIPTETRAEQDALDAQLKQPVTTLQLEEALRDRVMDPPRHPPSDRNAAALEPLLHLSHELLESDPQLGALVRHLAERRRAANNNEVGIVGAEDGHTVRARELLKEGGEVHLDDAPDRAGRSAVERYLGNTNARTVVDPNKAFLPSDIVAYPEVLLPETSSSALVVTGSSSDAIAGATTSMHDIGYETWSQRAIDAGAAGGDPEPYLAYRAEVTDAMGRLLAVEARTQRAVAEEVSSRDPIAPSKLLLPPEEDASTPPTSH